MSNVELELLAYKYFNVELPVISSVLKSAFRAASKRLHTDVGGSHDEFIRMKATYDAIQKMGLVVNTEDAPKTNGSPLEIYADGTPLTELGLGLGPTVNGKPCDGCSGRGYNPYTHQTMVRCNCARIRFDFPRRWLGCAKCHYRGEYPVGQPQTRYARCGVCNGAGEIKIYNPVILKGAMTQTQRKKQR